MNRTFTKIYVDIKFYACKFYVRDNLKTHVHRQIGGVHREIKCRLKCHLTTFSKRRKKVQSLFNISMYQN